jgi:hypothetical protein
MHTIDLAYVGLGIHEELIAYVADREEYFGDVGVNVAFRDGTKWKTERLRAGATNAGQSFSELPGDRHGVSANASKTKPAKLLAVFVVDTSETELTIPFGN